MRLHFANLLCCLGIIVSAAAQKNIRLNSPDGNIVFSFKVVSGKPMYSIAYQKKPLVDYSNISLQFDDGAFGNNTKAGKPVYRAASEDYELITGKAKSVHHPYKELLLPLVENDSKHPVNLVVRAFNDGLAFRYELPAYADKANYVLTDENTHIQIAGDPIARVLQLPSYTSSHEGLYTTASYNELKEDTLMDMPALFEFPGQAYMAVTEAALRDYAGMYLVKHDGVLTSRLSPLPRQSTVKVKARLPHQSPWRVFMISDRVGALIESNILTSLNEPCRIKDLSWVKPGKTTFPWWNGNVVPDTINAPGNNFVTNQYYIDFCARTGLQYHSVVEYGLHQWYTDDGVSFQPGPHPDVTKPVPGLDMKQICDYAKSKGVDIRVWVHWGALYPKLDTAFQVFEQWGLTGMMVDFMDRDDQEMVNIQEEILQKAAAHHLHIQFHGAYKPTGMSRTYPNEFTREGTLNYETNKWNHTGLSPDHDIMMPFTRMLAGSTDYHLGGFRAVPPSKFRLQFTRPLMIGTRCHMLAMYVVLENAIGMVCDYPEAYEGQPGFEFIQAVPTVWDETKVLDAKVGEYIVIARRKGDEWYIGAITNNAARTVNVDYSFLPEGNYSATMFTDAADDATEPNHLNKQIKSLRKTDVSSLQLAAGGGFAIHLKKE